MTFSPPLLRDWCAEVDADDSPEWLIEDFVLSDAAVLMSGVPTRAYKSWLAFQMALVVASGKAQGNLRPGPEIEGVGAGVLVLEFEGPRKPTRNRFRMLENSHGVDIGTMENFWFSHREEMMLDNPEHVSHLVRFVQRHNIKMVVIDTLAKSNGGDENSAKDMSRTMKGVDALRNAGAACVYVHHTRKPAMNQTNADVDDEIRGSSALAGFYDIHLALRRRSQDDNTINLTIRSNEAEEKYFDLQWHIDSEAQTATLEMRQRGEQGFTDSQCETKLAEILDKKRLYTQAELGNHWTKLSISERKDVIKKLVKLGRLETVGRKYKIVAKTNGVHEKSGNGVFNGITQLKTLYTDFKIDSPQDMV